MKKLAIFLVTIIVVSFLFHSCKKKDETEPTTTTKPGKYYIQYTLGNEEYRLENDIPVLEDNIGSWDIRGQIQGEAKSTSSSAILGNITFIDFDSFKVIIFVH